MKGMRVGGYWLGILCPFTGSWEQLAWNLNIVTFILAQLALSHLHSNWSCSQQWDLALLSIIWSTFLSSLGIVLRTSTVCFLIASPLSLLLYLLQPSTHLPFWWQNSCILPEFLYFVKWIWPFLLRSIFLDGINLVLRVILTGLLVFVIKIEVYSLIFFINCVYINWCVNSRAVKGLSCLRLCHLPQMPG